MKPDQVKTLGWLAASFVLMCLAVFAGQHGGAIGWSLCVVCSLGMIVAIGALVGRG